MKSNDNFDPTIYTYVVLVQCKKNEDNDKVFKKIESLEDKINILLKIRSQAMSEHFFSYQTPMRTIVDGKESVFYSIQSEHSIDMKEHYSLIEGISGKKSVSKLWYMERITKSSSVNSNQFDVTVAYAKDNGTPIFDHDHFDDDCIIGVHMQNKPIFQPFIDAMYQFEEKLIKEKDA